MSLLNLLLVNFLSFASSQNSFTYCTVADPSSFNPQIASDGATFAATRALYSGLLKFQYGGLKVEPHLAKRWKVSADGKKITFYLRDDVSFHTTKDFTPTRKLNADDVIFSLERMLNPKHPYHDLNKKRYKYFTSMEMSKVLDRIEKVDDHIVRIHLARPEASIISNLAMDFASILSKEYGDHLLKIKKREWIDEKPVGTGPFRLVDYKKEKYLQFAAHKTHFEGVPKVDHLRFLIVPEIRDRVNFLKDGKCHLAGNIPPRIITKLRKEPGLKVKGQPGLNIFYLAMNTQVEPFKDVRVRQAINLAIDRETLVKKVFGNHAQVAKSPIPPSMWGYDRHLHRYEYSPKRARELIKAANKDGKLRVQLSYMSTSRPYNPNGRLVAELIAEDLKKVGVKTQLVTKEWRAYLRSAAAGEHQFMQAGWTSDNGDPDNFLNLLLSCASVKGGSNYARWCNNEYSHLVGRARVTTDIRRRTDFYKKAQALFKDQAPWVPLAHVTLYKVLSSRVKGYKISPFGHDHFHSVYLQDPQK